jgi:hypothetical protein
MVALQSALILARSLSLSFFRPRMGQTTVTERAI